MIRLLLSIACIAFFIVKTNAQDLTGYWEGICKKYNNEYAFKADAEIKQTKENVEALLRITYRSESWFCLQEVQGNSKNNLFEFTGIRNVKQEHKEGFYWLLLRGTLQYDKREDRLYGWVDAYDVYNQEVYINHDFIELFRKNTNL